jgi:hypothetical protein
MGVHSARVESSIDFEFGVKYVGPNDCLIRYQNAVCSSKFQLITLTDWGYTELLYEDNVRAGAKYYKLPIHANGSHHPDWCSPDLAASFLSRIS